MVPFRKFGIPIALSLVMAAHSTAAQEVSDEDFERLDLSKLDSIINELNRKAEYVSIPSGSEDSPVGLDETPEQPLQVASSVRSPAMGLCFQGNAFGFQTADDMDSFLTDLANKVTQAEGSVRFAKSVADRFDKGQCSPDSSSIITLANSDLASIPSDDLPRLALHLLTCWPDEDMAENGGTAADMDRRYASVQQSMTAHGTISAMSKETKAWCGL